MKIERNSHIKIKGHAIPAVQIVPQERKGGVLLLHGYGGCKEELLGLAWRIAECGFAVCLIDLSGHGESSRNLDNHIVTEVEAALEYCRCFGKVTAIGHSLGGRLALTSSSDFAIGISPPLPVEIGKSVRTMLERTRSGRVMHNSVACFPDDFRRLPQWHPAQPALVIIGSKDFPEIIQSCKQIEESEVPVAEILGAMHHDIILYRETLDIIVKQLKAWYSH